MKGQQGGNLSSVHRSPRRQRRDAARRRQQEEVWATLAGPVHVRHQFECGWCENPAQAVTRPQLARLCSEFGIALTPQDDYAEHEHWWCANCRMGGVVL